MVSRTFTAFFIAALCFGQSLALPCHRPDMHRSSSSDSSTPAATPTSSADATIASANSSNNNNGNSNFGITPDQIRAVLSDTASCDSSPSCRTADQAAPFINQSFQKFNFNTVGEQAAIFSLMAFESGHFKFDTNLGGRAGQGTRNMMMFNYVLAYALEFNSDAVRGVRADLTSSSNPDDVSDDQKNAIRATVLGDDLSFASAAWFLREKCDGSVAQGLQAANDDGFNNYMTQCIGVGADPARLAIYQATLAAMNQQN